VLAPGRRHFSLQVCCAAPCVRWAPHARPRVRVASQSTQPPDLDSLPWTRFLNIKRDEADKQATSRPRVTERLESRPRARVLAADSCMRVHGCMLHACMVPAQVHPASFGFGTNRYSGTSGPHRSQFPHDLGRPVNSHYFDAPRLQGHGEYRTHVPICLLAGEPTHDVNRVNGISKNVGATNHQRRTNSELHCTALHCTGRSHNAQAHPPEPVVAGGRLREVVCDTRRRGAAAARVWVGA
jgi:hypothetical protein